MSDWRAGEGGADFVVGVNDNGGAAAAGGLAELMINNPNIVDIVKTKHQQIRVFRSKSARRSPSNIGFGGG
jgi:hypothetical protein